MSAVLVDTSVWVDHFRKGNDALIALLSQDQALTHPMIIAEIACGTPPAPRERTIGDLSLLPVSQIAGLSETMSFAERERLYGKGCGVLDLSLLASAMITPGAKLWTMDTRLADLARHFGIAHDPVRV